MTGAIAHRGPDDEQYHAEPGVILGARRLSIVDLAGGRQPMTNEDGSIWVAFNGELFEYPELREELLAAGHTLTTRCDTEAWVHLYEDHGEGMFARARGQFAVSLWDRRNNTLILGRDRVGICPLYYAERDGWLLWGSEIKAILSSGMVPIRPDPAGVDHLFSFFCAGTTRTFFEGIKSLAPGHYLKVKDGVLTTHCYWDLDFPDAGDEVRGVRPRAAGRRAGTSDAPVGRAPTPGRRAGRQLHQRWSRLDGGPRALLAGAGQGGPLVHDRLRERGARRAGPLDRERPGPGVAPDHDHAQ